MKLTWLSTFSWASTWAGTLRIIVLDSDASIQVSLKSSYLFQDQDLNVSDFTLTYFSHLYAAIISKALWLFWVLQCLALYKCLTECHSKYLSLIISVAQQCDPRRFILMTIWLASTYLQIILDSNYWLIIRSLHNPTAEQNKYNSYWCASIPKDLTQSLPTHPEVNGGQSSNCLLLSDLDLFTELAGTKHFDEWRGKQMQQLFARKEAGNKNHPSNVNLWTSPSDGGWHVGKIRQTEWH